jgi:hypothetical protein
MYSERYKRYPTRLIDISNRKNIHLIISAFEVKLQDLQYVTLSHRWSEGIPKLSQGNINRWLQNIPVEDLTKTFRDAIYVTRSLGCQYLWIDSLCIIQDCPEDWAAESLLMGEVYRNGICNIAAIAASHGSEGLFVTRDPGPLSQFMINLDFGGRKQSYSLARSDIWNTGLISSNLNRRGWVIQERLLSPRTISFGTQIFWECHELEACETWPDGLPPGLSSQGQWLDFGASEVLAPKCWPQILSTTSETSDDRYRIWKTIVLSYTTSNLTKEDDKLIALSGVAQQLQLHLDDEYLAGLWRKDLLNELVWYSSTLKKRPTNYRGMSFRLVTQFFSTRICHSYSVAPSWSWASVEGKIRFPWISRPGPHFCKLLEAKVYPKAHNVMGQLENGYLKISALIYRIPRNADLYGLNTRVPAGFYTSISWDALDSAGGQSFNVESASLCALPVVVVDNCWYRNQRVLFALLIQKSGTAATEYKRVGLLTLSVKESFCCSNDKISTWFWRNLCEESEGGHFSNDRDFEIAGTKWENDAWTLPTGEHCGHYMEFTLI